MGGMLARVHMALADYPVSLVCRTLGAPDLAKTIALIDRIEQAIGQVSDAGPRERRVQERLVHQRAWLQQAFRRLEVPPPVQVIHCDYQEGNVLFDGERIVAVFDWDDSGPGPRSYDILRPMHLMLFLDPEPCRSFLDGYRQVQPLEDDELCRGAVFYGLHRDCSTWLYEEAYLLDNQRVRERFVPEPFVPFERSWQVFVEAMGLADRR